LHILSTLANSPNQRKYLTEQELRQFLAVIKSPRDRAIFTLAYWRGLRASEIGRIPWTDWDQKKKKLYVFRLKHSLDGEFPLSPAETKALIAWREARGDKPGPMFSSRESSTFCSSDKGKKTAGIGRGMIHVLFSRYATQAGLPKHLHHPHALKHSLGTHLIAKGASLYEVKDWLGHRDIRSTMVYAQMRNAERDAAARKVYEQG
jgi:site-specific recombinase XerD